MEITKMLVLSTAHLSNDTCNRYLHRQHDLSTPGVVAFEKLSYGSPVRDPDSYGWFVHVPDEAALPDWPTDMPLELRSAIHVARRESCGWIMFDRDGDTIDELPTYDW